MMNRILTRIITALALQWGLAGFAAGPALAQSDISYILAATVSPPGFTPDHDGPVLLWRYSGTGDVTALPSIPRPPDSLINDPASVAFSAQRELFVGNREYNRGGGSIARFTFDVEGHYVPNGVIQGNGLGAVAGLAFSSSGELFATNYLADSISRFTFDGSGNAVPNGTIPVPPNSFLEGIAFSPSGELFTTEYSGVFRYLFDDQGNAIPNGSFTIPGSTRLHQIAFSATGELFLTSIDNATVYRYLFDTDGNPVPNGSFSASSPIGIGFSPQGELFVTQHCLPTMESCSPPPSRQIFRFVFDDMGNIMSNGTIVTPDSMGGVAVAPFPSGG
jgi:WD40 repeat protein